MQGDGIEPPQLSRLGYNQVSSPMLSPCVGWLTGLEPARRCYLHRSHSPARLPFFRHNHRTDDRIRTCTELILNQSPPTSWATSACFQFPTQDEHLYRQAKTLLVSRLVFAHGIEDNRCASYEVHCYVCCRQHVLVLRRLACRTTR